MSGYEYAQDQYVLIDPREISAARPKSDKAISIASFVAPGAVDASYYSGRNYSVLPEGKVADKPYALLHRAMVESKRHALAQVVISQRQHVALLRPKGPVLMLSLLCYQQELKDAAEFERAAPGVEVSAAELKMAKMLTEAMSVDEVDLSEYRDTYTDQVRAMIEAKARGKQKLVGSSPPDMGDRIINLMEALERSLKHAKSEKPAKRRKAS